MCFSILVLSCRDVRRLLSPVVIPSTNAPRFPVASQQTCSLHLIETVLRLGLSHHELVGQVPGLQHRGRQHPGHRVVRLGVAAQREQEDLATVATCAPELRVRVEVARDLAPGLLAHRLAPFVRSTRTLPFGTPDTGSYVILGSAISLRRISPKAQYQIASTCS